jgi:hypothetical protein
LPRRAATSFEPLPQPSEATTAAIAISFAMAVFLSLGIRSSPGSSPGGSTSLRGTFPAR